MGSRGISFFDHESALLQEEISAAEVSGISTFAIKSYVGGDNTSVGIGTTARYDLGRKECLHRIVLMFFLQYLHKDINLKKLTTKPK